jgi:hypothetical protein
VNETVQWIVEKDTVLSSDDYGKDLASVNALKRKHDGLERDLVALDDKVQNLSSECDQLKESHPEVEEDIEAKKEELVQAWDGLKQKVIAATEILHHIALVLPYCQFCFLDFSSHINLYFCSLQCEEQGSKMLTTYNDYWLTIKNIFCLSLR